MNGPDVLWQMLRDRWRSLTAWSVATTGLIAIMVWVYPSIRDTASSLDAYVESLPQSFRDAFGLQVESIGSPAGYLASQLYANMYPVLLLILAIGAAAWTVAGSEADGTIELALANPVRRSVLALWRFVGVVVLVVVVTVVSTVTLALLAPAVDLDAGLPPAGLWWAALTMVAMVLLFAALTFCVGAATGRKAAAIAAGSTAAVVTFLGQVLGGLADALTWMRDASPWWWLLRDNPVTTAPGWISLVLPVAITALLVVVGIIAVNRRDLRV